VRRAISVLKKRSGAHENTIREFSISSKGITVGPVLQEFQGVLRGVPEYVGARSPMLDEKNS
jgi:circadian clock protein KaiC